MSPGFNDDLVAVDVLVAGADNQSLNLLNALLPRAPSFAAFLVNDPGWPATSSVAWATVRLWNRWKQHRTPRTSRHERARPP